MATSPLVHESAHRKFPPVTDGADALLALHGRAADLTDTYNEALSKLVDEAALICNDVDAADDKQIVDDFLSDLAGDTFG